jgi:tol-pal system protein YbgF
MFALVRLLSGLSSRLLSGGGVLAMVLALSFTALAPAHAALFEDSDARKAILELRQRLDQSEQQRAKLLAESSQQIEQLKRSLLDLNTQIELMRGDLAKMRGTEEQLTRDVSEVQRQQRDIQQGVDARMSKLEPQKVSVDGRDFLADVEEKRQFDDALGVLRKGDFPGAATALSAFQRRYPASGYTPSVLFWLGNAQYGKREYREAMTSFRTLVANHADHPRAPEALLSVANCQLELKDTKSARRTLDELLKAYPQSEAAQAGRQRIASLR